MTKVEIDLDTIIDELDAIKKDIARYKFELKQLEDEKEKRELQLAALLNQLNVKEMQHKNMVFGFKITSRQALDQKLLKEKYPEQYQDCYVKKEKEDFFVKLVK